MEWKFVMILSISSCFCDATQGLSLFQNSMIDLNPDGSVAARTQMPSCQSGQVIQIIKFISHRKVCNSICLNIPSNGTSPEVEDRLYDMCSLKERCTNMSFPSEIIERNRITGLNVSYQCIDSTKAFIGICENKAVFFTSDTHLMGMEKTEHFKECRCFINGGTFMISLTDLRLKSKSGRNCSSTALQINSKSYDCSKPDYEDTFSKTVEDSVSKAFISITSATDSSTPKMLWLTLRPKDSTPCSVECIGIPRYDNSRTYSILQSSNITEDSNLMRNSAITGQEMSHVNTVAIIVSTSLAVVIACVAVGVAIYCIIIRSKCKSKNRKQCSPKTDTVGSKAWEPEEMDPLNESIIKGINSRDVEKQEGAENMKYRRTPQKPKEPV